MSTTRWFVLGALAVAGPLATHSASAQLPARAEERIRTALPSESADRVLATIAAAHSRELSGTALENRALELVAKGVRPGDIETAVSRHAEELENAKIALARGGRPRPSADETEAAATAMGNGVDGRLVSELAKSTPAARAIAVPIYVLQTLILNGEPVENALAHVRADLAAGFADARLQGQVQQRPGPREPASRPAGPPVSAPGAGRIPVPSAHKGNPDVPPDNPAPPGNPGLKP